MKVQKQFPRSGTIANSVAILKSRICRRGSLILAVYSELRVDLPSGNGKALDPTEAPIGEVGGRKIIFASSVCRSQHYLPPWSRRFLTPWNSFQGVICKKYLPASSSKGWSPPMGSLDLTFHILFSITECAEQVKHTYCFVYKVVWL